jgi:hypothetical protein
MPKNEKEVAAIVSAAGFLTTIYTDLAAMIAKMGGKSEYIYRLATPQGKSLLQHLALDLVSEGREEDKVYGTEIPNASIPELLTHSPVTKWDFKFPIIGAEDDPWNHLDLLESRENDKPGKRNLRLVRCPPDVSEEHMHCWMLLRGYRQTGFKEFLCFAEQHEHGLPKVSEVGHIITRINMFISPHLQYKPLVHLLYGSDYFEGSVNNNFKDPPNSRRLVCEV